MLTRGWVRGGDELIEVSEMNGHVSPPLVVRFDTSGGDLVLYRPDGKRFLTNLEFDAEEAAERERAEEQARRADRLAEKLRELGIDPGEVAGGD